MSVELLDLITGKRTQARDMRHALEKADNRRLSAYKLTALHPGGDIVLLQIGSSTT